MQKNFRNYSRYKIRLFNMCLTPEKHVCSFYDHTMSAIDSIVQLRR